MDMLLGRVPLGAWSTLRINYCARSGNILEMAIRPQPFHTHRTYVGEDQRCAVPSSARCQKELPDISLQPDRYDLISTTQMVLTLTVYQDLWLFTPQCASLH